MEQHISIFRPYERDAKHEDQLTRAALIVLKLVPLAHEAFLGLAGCQRLSALPHPRFALQTERLVPLESAQEEAEFPELVSVFLGPHESIADAVVPNIASQRRARYDGVVQYGSRLLVVIESKLFAAASKQQSLDINTRGITPEESRWVHVRWQDLLDQWWNLMELGVLNSTEVGILNDFFDNAEENFGDLLPYTDLRRCGDHRGRRVRRLRGILEKATGLAAEVRDVWGHAGVQFPQGQVVAVDRVSLFVEGTHLVVCMWPAELAPQYKRVYADAEKAEALISLVADPAWEIDANFQLSFWRASVARRWYPDRHIGGVDYVRQWLEDVHKHAGRKPREDLHDPNFRRWLIERGYAVENEMASLDDWADALPLDKFDVRPGIQVRRTWSWEEAVDRDSSGRLVDDVRTAINQVLIALAEPRLENLRQVEADWIAPER